MLRRLALWEGVALFPVSRFSDTRFSHLVTPFVHSCPAFLYVQDVFRALALEQQQWRLQLQHGGAAVRSVGVARLRLRARGQGFAV